MPLPPKHGKHQDAEHSDNEDGELDNGPKKVVHFVWSTEVDKAFTQIKRRRERRRSSFWSEASHHHHLVHKGNLERSLYPPDNPSLACPSETQRHHLTTAPMSVHSNSKKSQHQHVTLSSVNKASIPPTRGYDARPEKQVHKSCMSGGFVVQISKLPQLYTDMLSMRRRKGIRNKSIASSAFSRVSLPKTPAPQDDPTPSESSSTSSGCFTPSPEHRQRTEVLLSRIPRDPMAYTKKTFKSSRISDVCNYPDIHMIDYPRKKPTPSYFCRISKREESLSPVHRQGSYEFSSSTR